MIRTPGEAVTSSCASAGTFETTMGGWAELRRSQGFSGRSGGRRGRRGRLRRIRILGRQPKLGRRHAARREPRCAPRRPRSRSASRMPATSGRYTLRVDGRDVTTASSMPGGDDPARRHTARRRPGHGVGEGNRRRDARRGLNRSWAFTVDTHAPPLRLTALPSGWVREHTLALTGHTQPGVRVTAAADAVTAHAIAGGDGAFASRWASRTARSRWSSRRPTPPGTTGASPPTSRSTPPRPPSRSGCPTSCARAGRASRSTSATRRTRTETGPARTASDAPRSAAAAAALPGAPHALGRRPTIQPGRTRSG